MNLKHSYLTVLVCRHVHSPIKTAVFQAGQEILYVHWEVARYSTDYLLGGFEELPSIPNGTHFRNWIFTSLDEKFRSAYSAGSTRNS
jgi:hypothetical protein